MRTGSDRAESLGWVVAMALVVSLAIPWFLWGSDRMLAGLPMWLWWHVGWLLLAALVFWGFARRAWGLGITDSGTIGAEGGDR
ncbi:MAG: DUF3311 domain-containing protein [Halodesulfurarchaeum sp.]